MADDLLIDPSPSLIGGRASRGVVFLLLRYGGVQLTGLAANIALSRLLHPDAYGIYAISLFVLVVMAFVSDFGFGPALLQKPASITPPELGTVFTTQQAVLGALVIAVFLAAPALGQLYHLGSAGVWYFRAVAVAGAFTSLKTVPTIVLERKLLYGRLALVDVAEVVTFQATAVVLAVLHQGAWSFIWAVLVSKGLGCLLSYALSGWRPAFGFVPSAFAGLWSFAAPFQLTWLTYLLRDYMIPIVGGILVGTTQVGYLNWALALAAVPGQMAQIVGRVAFPSFSRLQSDPDRLRRAIATSVRTLFLVAVPLQLMVFALAPWLIHVVFSDRWAPALLPLYLLCIHWAGANLTSPLVAALNATGRPGTALALNAAWTVTVLVVALGLVKLIGYVGFALAYALTMVGAAAACVILARRAVGVHLWTEVRMPLLCSLVFTLAGTAAVRLFPAGLATLVVTAVALGLGYLGLLWLLEGSRLRRDVRSLAAIGMVRNAG